ncbi:MAG: serine/threonine-protein kinase [Anaerolineae bacterium]|nr:serine/threonine-protein kinase [Anaerolineae bacterium]
MSDDLIDKSLGQYQIRVLLGRGGMSTVYLAYQPSMDRTVAIKILPREFLHDKTFLARFEQEGRTIAKLEHLHILPVYDFGEDDGIPYIVMRYLAGGTLADLIFGRLPPLATTVRLIAQVADALDYAHGAGIIHRDLKPSNVLLDNSGNAYLADFGIARVVQAAQSANLTGSRVIGTPPYIAPEMVKKDQKITTSVDIYALGIITFEMLTGRAPFHDEDPMKVLMAHVLEPVPSARAVDPKISPEVDEVVMRCLAKTPQQRYKTAADYAADLARAATAVQRSQSAASTTPAKPVDIPSRLRSQSQSAPIPMYTPSGEAFQSEKGRPFWLFVLAAIGALGLGIVLIILAILGGEASGLLGMVFPSTGTPTPTVTPTQSISTSPTQTRPTAILSSPSGGNRLVFASKREGDYDLYLIDSDGENLRQITESPGEDYDPAWSPDGTRIAYVSSADGHSNIVVIHIACILSSEGCDSSVRKLTDNAAEDVGPAWSPDGTQIAFASNRDGNYQIYTMTADGQEQHRLTYNSRHDLSPSWSPDGKQIVYHASDGHLYVINTAGGTPQKITGSDGADNWPDWSPKANHIAYTSTADQSSGQRAIFTIDLASNLTTQLTTGSRDDDPVWSPDGAHIAFASDRESTNRFDIVVLEVASGILERLTTEGNNVAPDWQPQS